MTECGNNSFVRGTNNFSEQSSCFGNFRGHDHVQLTVQSRSLILQPNWVAVGPGMRSYAI